MSVSRTSHGCGVHLPQRLLRRGGLRDVAALLFQQPPQQLPCVTIVVHHEHPQIRQRHRIPSLAGRASRACAFFRQRQRDGEDSSETGAVTVGAYRAAVHVHDLPGDAQPEAEAALPARGRAVSLPEPVEHGGKKVRANALAAVTNDKLRLATSGCQVDLHESAGRRELDAVPDQVGHNLLEPRGVARDPHVTDVVGRHRQGHTLGASDGLQRVGGSRDDFGEPVPCQREADLAGHDARHVEQVFDQLGLGLRVAHDGVDCRRERWIVRGPPQDVGPADDGVQRSPQLVAQRGEELVLQQRCPLRLGAREPLRFEQLLAVGLRFAHVTHRVRQLLFPVAQGLVRIDEPLAREDLVGDVLLDDHDFGDAVLVVLDGIREPAQAPDAAVRVAGCHELALRQLDNLAGERTPQQRLHRRVLPGPLAVPGTGRWSPEAPPGGIDVEDPALRLEGEDRERRLLDDPAIPRFESGVREPESRPPSSPALPTRRPARKRRAPSRRHRSAARRADPRATDARRQKARAPRRCRAS